MNAGTGPSGGIPPEGQPAPRRLADDRLAELARAGLWLLLILSWAVAVWYMWDAMTTIPSAERLQESRMTEIPGPRRFLAAAAFSAMEVGVVLAVLWPWKPGYWASRLALSALALFTWFVTTIPMDLSRMDWVHRRWLVFLVATLLGALVTTLAYRGARKWLGVRR